MIQIYDALHKRIAAIDMMDDLKIEKTVRRSRRWQRKTTSGQRKTNTS